MRIEVAEKVPIILCVACEKELASNRLIFNQKHGIAAPLCNSCLDDLGRIFIESKNATGKLLKYTELIQLLENEINWCKDHSDIAPSPEYLDGFIAGLGQAKHFATSLTNFDELDFREFRADGWPLCPKCGKDELWCPGLARFHRANRRNPTVNECIEMGLRCYRCLTEFPGKLK